MILKCLAGLTLVLSASCAVASPDADFSSVNIYCMRWESILMSNASLDRMRKDSDIKTSSTNDNFMYGLANRMNIKAVDASNVPAKGSFTLYLVIDFFAGSKRITYVSDGSQLCTEDKNHCVDVDEDFKRRFDPSYDWKSGPGIHLKP